MKHEKIYYTCDRCGQKIVGTSEIPFMRRFWGKKIDLSIDTTTYEPKTNLTDALKDADKKSEIATLLLETHYNTKRNSYELCGQCRKDFVRFMNNKEV